MKKNIAVLPIFIILVLSSALSSCGADAKIVKFDTRPEAPFSGDSVTLYWEVKNADDVTLDGAPVPAVGQKRVLLDKSQDFILTAKGSHSEATKTLEIVAQPK
ncbi:MAG TPA: hypothetical protein VFO76_09925 [Candidatus Kapabacteria bacterium]|nr:hypothetical protein [Candidatus Kapabacteria bacterium]